MIILTNVSKSFTSAGKSFQAVAPASLHVKEGEIYGIIGFSGAGKSTFLRFVNLIEQPDTGTVTVNGQELTRLSKKELRKARQSIGMVFQHFNLLHNRTVAKNVELALEISGVPKEERKTRAKEALEIVGLSDKVESYPAQLSGGQKQRVAIARALSTRPKVLLCDEPTSALDPQTTRNLLSFLQEINQQLGVTILLVTHEMEVVKRICNKVAVMEDGNFVENFELNGNPIHAKTEIGQLLFDLVKDNERGIIGV